MKLVRLRNLAAQANSFVLSSGKAVRLTKNGTPGCQFDGTEEEILELEEHFGDLVMRVGERDVKPKSYVEYELPEAVWVANVTGDPDEPERLFLGKEYNKKTKETEEIYEANERFLPVTVREGLGDRDEIFESENLDGISMKCSRTVPGHVVTIDPLSNVELPPHEARTILSRDKARPIHQRGKVIQSRDITKLLKPDFDDWTLDQMRAYLRLSDATVTEAQLGPTEAQLRKDLGEDTEEFAYALHEAKHKAFARCMRRVLDPKFTIPSQDRFEKFMRREETKAKTNAQLAEARARKAAKGQEVQPQE